MQVIKKAIILAIIATFILSPVVALAESTPQGKIAIDPLPEGAGDIQVAVGTGQDEIPFPSLTLGDTAIDGVSWQCELGYLPDTAGDYVFVPQLPEGYLAENTTVVVTVAAKSQVPPAEGAVDDTENPPTGVSAIAAGQHITIASPEATAKNEAGDVSAAARTTSAALSIDGGTGLRPMVDPLLQGWDDISSAEWMRYLSSDLKINQINMPGTHDSGTQYVTLGFENGAQCQDTNIRTQLNNGVRFLDMRLRYDDNYAKGERLRLTHNTIDCLEDDDHSDHHLKFEDVLENWIYPFLDAHPTETIVLCVMEQGSDESGSDGSNAFAKELLLNYVNLHSNYWITSDTAPTLREARGKIVLMRRYKNPAENEGLDFSKWRSEAEETFAAGGATATVQDKYNGYSMYPEDDAYIEGGLFFDDILIERSKWTNVTNMLKKCEQGKYSRDNYVINFTSANNAGKLPLLYPYQYADEINNNITGADSSKKYNWKRVTDSSATPVHYGWIVMDFVTEGMCRPIYSTNKFVEQKYGLHYADSSEDKRFYYLGYAFDQESGNIGRMVAVDYTPNGGSTTRYDKQVITTDAAAYKAMLEKKQLYPGISYTVTLYEVGLADKILSNKIAYSVQLPQETPDVTLTYPEWVMDGAASVEMKLSYSLAYKNDGVTYAVYDPVQNKIVVQGSEPTLQVPNPVPGRAYDGTINVAYPEGRTFWYEGRTKYEPKILAQPEQLVTTPTCDSVEVGWNYSGDVEQFRIALENSTGDKLFEKYTTAQSVEFIGLDAGTDYVARVTAIGGGMENTSEPLSFTTAPPPQATISPTFHYFDNPSDPKTLNVAIDTAVTGDHYTWNIQYAGETGWQPIGTDASSLSIRANEFNTYGSIALIKCDVTWDGGSATTNRIVLCGVPAKPANFQSPSQGLDSITLSWDAIPGTEAYQLTYPNVELWIAPEATSVTITGLEHGTEYDFTLIAVGQGPLGHRYESDSAECTAQTLADAEAPENVQISKVPEEIAAYTEDITYTATAGLPPGGGVLSYQWQVQGTDGLFVDMAGETRNTCTVSPSTEIMAKKIRCVVTNTLHGTTASVTTDELYILFKPPAVTEITATPSDSLGAKRIDVKWKNPAMFDHYIVVCTPASAGAGVQTLPDGVVSQIAAQAILPEGSRVRIVKGNGAPGAEKELQLHGLKPGTAYNIHIENVLKHPFEEGYLPADLSDIVTVRVATLPGAGTPVITDNSGDQTVEDGKRATFSATATAPDYGNTFYRWRAISPTLEESAVLSRGTLAGTQVLECSADASLDLDGYYYILDVVSINNGDVSIATSQPVTLHVWREAPPSPPNETSGANTGDSSSILLWIILAIISAVAILVLKKVHRKNEGIEE